MEDEFEFVHELFIDEPNWLTGVCTQADIFEFRCIR